MARKTWPACPAKRARSSRRSQLAARTAGGYVLCRCLVLGLVVSTQASCCKLQGQSLEHGCCLKIALRCALWLVRSSPGHNLAQAGDNLPCIRPHASPTAPTSMSKGLLDTTTLAVRVLLDTAPIVFTCWQTMRQGTHNKFSFDL